MFKRAPDPDPIYGPYIAQVNAQPLTFRVEAGHDDRAWERALEVLRKYHRSLRCRRGLSVTESRTIECVPIGRDRIDYAGAAFLYQIRREPMGQETEYTIAFAQPSRYNTVKPLRIARAMANARIIAFYMVSGKIWPRAFEDDRLL